MFRPTLVPVDFEIPTFATDRYHLEPLTMRWLVQDYAAVIDSWPYLDGKMVFPGTLGPVASYTLEDDVIELGWHEREFRTRRSFAYLAITHDDTRSVGCAYLYASPRPGNDAALVTWARHDPDEPEADDRFHAEIKAWVDARWPFTSLGCPGRDSPWDEWHPPG